MLNKLLIGLMVLFMSIEGMTYGLDWNHFNSSLLMEVTRPNGIFTCSAVAVSDRTLLTAAHCLDGEVLKVRVFTQEHYDPKLPSLEILNFKVHPNYNPKRSAYSSDLAKVVMKEKLPSFIHLYPIFEGKVVTGSLYRFGFGARNKQNLRTVITPTLKNLNLQEEIVELNDQYSRSGDSGGPIYLQNGKGTFILAIHSTYSHGPQGNFSFNPLLAPFLPWIYAN